MKKILIIIILAAFSILAYAQDTQVMTKPNTNQTLQHLTERLNLTLEQQNDIKPILDVQVKLLEEHQANRQKNDNSILDDKIDARINSILDDKIDARINSILTEEQQIEYKKMQKEMRLKKLNIAKKKQ